ncbi:MAG: aldo/keto reductase [Desulfobacterales bacterium]|jgi:hypothetical protein
MINGYANKKGTALLPKAFPGMVYRPAYESGPLISQAGFGGYRIDRSVAGHDAALRAAVRGGINLIDTSANYGDGGSETLIGQVMATEIERSGLSRASFFVVSKAGYLQGTNYASSQERKRQGRPFEDVVTVAQGLEHCIHPTFLEDQLTRSLRRLGLETLDAYLLHNPEYYLGWAARRSIDIETARAEYLRRLRLAFEHLEGEVDRGRIRCYGISSNTFPAAADDAQFTNLEALLHAARSISRTHHLRVIQFPMNLFESGPVLESNQPSGATLLEAARGAGLGVLVNRPLNAVSRGRLIRLAEVSAPHPSAPKEIDRRIDHLLASEAHLIRSLLPERNLDPRIENRLSELIGVGAYLRRHKDGLDSLAAWDHLRTTVLEPRILGVYGTLEQMGASPPEQEWMVSHQTVVEGLFKDLTSLAAAASARSCRTVREAVREVTPDWAPLGLPLSQTAIRALRCTDGVTCILVGMRRERYVSDVLEEMARPCGTSGRQQIWRLLNRALADI